jgi:hypothetical protein
MRQQSHEPVNFKRVLISLRVRKENEYKYR